MRLDVRLCFAVLLSFSGVLVTSSAHAQNNPPDLAIRGVVLDSSRAAIVGARVDVSAASPAQPVSATTDQHGAFTLRVAAGQYDLRITAEGFATFQQNVTAAPTT